MIEINADKLYILSHLSLNKEIIITFKDKILWVMICCCHNRYNTYFKQIFAPLHSFFVRVFKYIFI